MKDIFSDLYDKVLSFFTTQNQDDTKVVAKNRLKTVLKQDRVGFSERAMQMLREDLVDTISRYLEIDVDSFDLSIDAGNNGTTILNLSIPVVRPKTDDEIDEALTIQQKATIEKTQEIVGEIKELVKEKAQELAEQISQGENQEDENKDEESDSSEEESSQDKEVKKENK